MREFAKTSAQLGTLVGTRMREGDLRDEQLLAFQKNVERLTRWLVRLTVVLAVLTLTGIAATVWAALK